MYLYDQIRKIMEEQFDASTELQEALITWYMTHPEDYIRVEERMKERVDIQVEQR